MESLEPPTTQKYPSYILEPNNTYISPVDIVYLLKAGPWKVTSRGHGQRYRYLTNTLSIIVELRHYGPGKLNGENNKKVQTTSETMSKIYSSNISVRREK